MELTQETLNNIAASAALLSFVCPLCRKLIIPQFTLKNDEIETYISKTFIEDKGMRTKVMCCENCAKRIGNS